MRLRLATGAVLALGWMGPTLAQHAGHGVGQNQAPQVRAPEARSSATVPTGPRQVRVTVGAEGFEPRTIQAETGDSVALYLTRTTDATCAKEVSFFGRGVQVALPKDQEIKVTIDVDEPGVVKFGCLSGDEGAIIKVSANRRQ